MFHGVPNDTAVAMDDEKLDVRNLSIMDFRTPDPPILTTVHWFSFPPSSLRFIITMGLLWDGI